MQLYLGIAVIFAAVYFIIKQYETRLVLFLAGFALACIAGEPLSAFKAFSKALTQNKLFEPIVTVMGFSVVMKITGCDQHLIHLLARGVKRMGFLLIPSVVMATFFVNISLTSTAGISAAVGAIFIPLLMAAGVHPAVAGAAVLSGTYGSFLNPGYPMNVIVADVAKTTPIAVIGFHAATVILAGVTSGLVLAAVAFLRKEHKGFAPLNGEAKEGAGKTFAIHPLKAMVPLFPLVLILISNMKLIPGMKPLAISHSMFIGIFLCFAITRECPSKLSNEFFKGFGSAFGHIFGIIICAFVFVDGMKTLGLIKMLTDAMIANPAIAKVSSAYGPFLIAVMSGSGEAASTAFNTAVTINADQFGLSPVAMGSVSSLSGAFGRAMSPLAGGVIICAGHAGVTPIEIVKRGAPGMFIACTLTAFLSFYVFN